jgi:hypothetical protein
MVAAGLLLAGTAGAYDFDDTADISAWWTVMGAGMSTVLPILIMAHWVFWTPATRSPRMMCMVIRTAEYVAMGEVDTVIPVTGFPATVIQALVTALAMDPSPAVILHRRTPVIRICRGGPRIHQAAGRTDPQAGECQ